MNRNESDEQPFVAWREPAGDVLCADPVEEGGRATGAGPAGDKARRLRSANEGKEQAVGGSLLQQVGLAMGTRREVAPGRQSTRTENRGGLALELAHA
jgi:hypothetical protein